MANDLVNKMEAYRPLIEQASQEYGVPANLLAGLLAQESRFNPQAKSPAGAMGIAQFMPQTAKDYGIDPYDPKQAIPASAKYLSNSYKKLGNWDHSLASYNAGLGAVNKYGGIPPFKETQAYVPGVNKYAEQFKGSFGDGMSGMQNTLNSPVVNAGQLGIQPDQQPLDQMAMSAPTPNGGPAIDFSSLMAAPQQPSKFNQIAGLLSVLGGTAANLIGGIKGGNPNAGNAGIQAGNNLLGALQQGGEDAQRKAMLRKMMLAPGLTNEQRTKLALLDSGMPGEAMNVIYPKGANPMDTLKDQLQLKKLQQDVDRNSPAGIQAANQAEINAAVDKQKALQPLELEKLEKANDAKGKFQQEMAEFRKTLNTNDPVKISAQAQSLRKEFLGQQAVKDYMVLDTQVAKANQVWETYKANPNDAKSKNFLDQSIITTFNKMIDPSSVVRESEYARTPEGLSALGRLDAYKDKIVKGGAGLADTDRQDLVNTMQQLHQGASVQFNDLKDFYTDEALRMNIPPERIVGVFDKEEKKPDANAPITGFKNNDIDAELKRRAGGGK